MENSKKTGQSVLPERLPMSAFEEYMYLDSQPGYPMDCHTRLCWNGRFSHTDIEQAVAEALRYHPLLSSHCVSTRRGRPAWQLSADTEIVSDDVCSRVHGIRICWAKGKCREAYPAEVKPPIDMDAETPLRIVVLEEVDAAGDVIRTDWFFKFHHSMADALGMMRFTQDLMICYALRTGANPAIWADYEWPDLSLLLTRGKCGRNTWGWIKIYLTSRWWLRRSMMFLFRRLLPMAKNAPKEITRHLDAQYPARFFECLSVEKTAHWMARCRELNGTLNDFLLHASYMAMAQWRAEHPENAFPGSGALRIAIPTNLRNAALKRLPATNTVSMVFMDRKPTAVNASQAFFDGIRQEMLDVKRWELGFMLVRGIMDARNIHILKWAIQWRNCWASLVLTNVGRVLDAKFFPFTRNAQNQILLDGAVLEQLEGASPIRPLTSVTLCAMTYAGQIQLTLFYDSRLLTEELAADFFQRVQKNMDELLA